MSPGEWVRPFLLPLAVTLLAGVAASHHARIRRRAALRSHLELDGSTVGGRGVGRLRVLGWGMVALALVGPVLRSAPSSVEGDRLVVWVGWDLSASMAAAAPVSRFDAGRAVVRDLLSGAPGLRVGLAVFGDGAHVLLPPTSDPTVVSAFIDALEPGTLGTGATSADALAGLVEITRPTSDVDAPPAVVLLVSDGEWEGDARIESSTPVHAIWTDVPRTAPVSTLPSEAVGLDRRASGETVARPEALRAVTAASGGIFAPASDPAAVESVRLAISRAGVSARHPDPVSTPVDATPVFALAAALLLLGVRRPEGGT